LAHDILVIDGLRASYGRGEVLRGVSLRVKPGEICGILGPNASGKTTLLRCIAGILKPTGGRISLGGKDRRALSPRSFARAASLLLDEMAPAEMRVMDYVLLARSLLRPALSPVGREDMALAKDGLSAMGVLDVAGSALAELSLGQLQRVRLARVLAQDTPLLLLDEPTAHLDPGHGFVVMEKLRALADSGKAGLVVLHSLDLAARFTDSVLILASGATAFTGPTHDVLTPRAIREVFGVGARRTQTGGLDIYPG